jgi:hypothetical protein
MRFEESVRLGAGRDAHEAPDARRGRFTRAGTFDGKGDQ